MIVTAMVDGAALLEIRRVDAPGLCLVAAPSIGGTTLTLFGISMSTIKHLTWLLALALTVALPREAAACSCSGGPLILLPRDGSTNVPTNVHFMFGPSSMTHPPGTRIELQGNGTFVAVFSPVSGVQRVAAPMLLQPDTQFVLSFGGSAGESVSFRTGPGPDNSHPVLEDFDFLSYGTPPISVGPSCGKYQAIAFKPVGASDDATPTNELNFDFYSGTTPDTVDLSSPVLGLGPDALLSEGACQDNFPLSSTPQISGALVAVDLAGNRSAPTRVRIIKGGGGCSSAPTFMPLAALCMLVGSWRRRCAAG